MVALCALAHGAQPEPDDDLETADIDLKKISVDYSPKRWLPLTGGEKHEATHFPRFFPARVAASMAGRLQRMFLKWQSLGRNVTREQRWKSILVACVDSMGTHSTSAQARGLANVLTANLDPDSPKWRVKKPADIAADLVDLFGKALSKPPCEHQFPIAWTRAGANGRGSRGTNASRRGLRLRTSAKKSRAAAIASGKLERQWNAKKIQIMTQNQNQTIRKLLKSSHVKRKASRVDKAIAGVVAEHAAMAALPPAAGAAKTLSPLRKIEMPNFDKILAGCPKYTGADDSDTYDASSRKPKLVILEKVIHPKGDTVEYVARQTVDTMGEKSRKLIKRLGDERDRRQQATQDKDNQLLRMANREASARREKLQEAMDRVLHRHTASTHDEDVKYTDLVLGIPKSQASETDATAQKALATEPGPQDQEEEE